MRTFLCTLLVVICAGAAWAEPVALRIGVQDASPPFAFLGEDGELTGFDVDIARTLCDEMSARCQLITSDFQGLIPGLAEDRFDLVVASLSITDARREVVDFTDKYYSSTARFVVRRDNDLEISDRGVRGRFIGVKRATTFENYLQDTYGEVAEILAYGTQDEALLDLLLGRLDTVLGDRIVLQENFLNSAVGSEFAFAGPALDDRRWFGEGIGIAIQKDRPDLLARLNKAISAIRDDGRYNRVRRHYFAYDIYGPATAVTAR